jgi:hypothetical protein
MDFLFSINLFWYLVALGIFLYLVYDAYMEGGLKEAIKFIIIFWEKNIIFKFSNNNSFALKFLSA